MPKTYLNLPAEKAAFAAKSLTGRNATVVRYADHGLRVADAWRSLQSLYQWWDQRTRYLVRIPADDPIYGHVQQWYLSNLPEMDRKAVVLESTRVDDQEDDDYGTGDSRKILTRSDDRQQRKFRLGQHTIRTWVEKSESPKYENDYAVREPDSIVFAARNLAGQHAIQDEIARVAREFRGRRRPMIHMMNSWGAWSPRPDLPLRPLDTVVLRDGQADGILADMRRFLDLEQRYVEGGMPWHRGYLFHGPPGTGKTSLARGLADALQMDLWYASLGDLSKDTNLLSLLSAVPPRSLLLLEDIDVLSASHQREGEPNQVSLAGLLNALDGVGTPHGLITIMTTNEVTNLDPALTRAGRMDVRILLDLLDHDQACAMFERFYGRPPSSKWLDLGEGVSAADLYEQFKRHIDEPEVVETMRIEHIEITDTDADRLPQETGVLQSARGAVIQAEARTGRRR